MFEIDNGFKWGYAPRMSLNYHPTGSLAFKAAYVRTNQYVYQLSGTYLSLPTDLWVPVTGNLKPMNADKLSMGVYWRSLEDDLAVSVEAYYKKTRNIVEYRDDYYLNSPGTMWCSKLCSGSGKARGIDCIAEKSIGKVSGSMAYSLAWAYRTFPDKTGGLPFPARFDNRHTVKLSLAWELSDNLSFNAVWVGHSGNRFTLLTQMWSAPGFDENSFGEDVPLKAPVNNYRLPFYHRLDLGCQLKNRRGFWSFSLFNAYCHLNTVAVRRAYNKNGSPVFQKVKLLPIIPSLSYTWNF